MEFLVSRAFGISAQDSTDPWTGLVWAAGSNAGSTCSSSPSMWGATSTGTSGVPVRPESSSEAR